MTRFPPTVANRRLLVQVLLKRTIKKQLAALRVGLL